jgi:hypothetical protein
MVKTVTIVNNISIALFIIYSVDFTDYKNRQFPFTFEKSYVILANIREHVGLLSDSSRVRDRDRVRFGPQRPERQDSLGR